MWGSRRAGPDPRCGPGGERQLTIGIPMRLERGVGES
jgi:hypothetical protein